MSKAKIQIQDPDLAKVGVALRRAAGRNLRKQDKN